MNIETAKYKRWEIQVYLNDDGLWYAHGNLNSAQYSTDSFSSKDRESALDSVINEIDRLEKKFK